MNQTQSSSNLLNSDLFEFKKGLLKVLAKFATPHTVTIGWEEVRRFMAVEITDHEHMVMFLQLLAESNDHMKLQQKKENLKIYGVAAEIFEEALTPYLPKILATFLKKSQEQTTDMYAVIAETLGVMALHLIDKCESYEAQVDLLNQFLKVPYQLLAKPSKPVQSCGALCLSKVIQNCSEDLVADCLDQIVPKICGLLKSNSFKAHATLVETLISVIFHVEALIDVHAESVIEVAIDLAKSDDNATKKVAIDAVYSLTAIIKEQILPYRI